MKKLLKTTVLVAAAFAFGSAVVACDDTDGPGGTPEPTKYTVSYAIGEGATGTAPTGFKKAKDEKFNLFTYDVDTATFSKEGWTFDGWKCSADNITYDAGQEYAMPDDNVTFTAQWKENAPKYAVTYVLSDGITGTAPEGGSYESGETVTVKPAPTQEGYRFLGWKRGDNNLTYTAGQTFAMPANVVTLTSVYVEYNPGVTYTVTVVKSTNDSQVSSVVGDVPTIPNKAAGDTFTIPADTFSLAHYTQSKWRVQRYTDGYWKTEANYDPTAEIIMPDYNIRIGAVWVANTVTISFDANGGSGTMADNTSKQFGNPLALTTSAFDCKFTAPAGKEFRGWALSPNGAVIANGTKLDETIVSPQDTLTLYAVWDVAASTALDISEIVGHWTDATNTHTFDIIANNMGSSSVQGAGVIDGKYLVQLQLDEEGNYVADLTQDVIASYFTYNDSTITLPINGSNVAFTNKTALSAANASAFTGNWSKGEQPWVITADKAYYGASLNQVNSVIIGSHIALYFNVADHDYVYVLGKNGEKLEGYYTAPEKDPEAVEFTAGEFYTLTVNGALNQIVNSGANVDANKLPASDNDGTITGWVIEGTSTAFDPATATITANTSITAVHDTAANVKTYTGSRSTDYNITSITINFDNNAIVFNGVTDPITVEPTVTAKGTGYYVLQGQGSGLLSAAMWIVVSEDGNTVKVYDNYNGPDELYGTYTLQA